MELRGVSCGNYGCLTLDENRSDKVESLNERTWKLIKVITDHPFEELIEPCGEMFVSTRTEANGSIELRAGNGARASRHSPRLPRTLPRFGMCARPPRAGKPRSLPHKLSYAHTHPHIAIGGDLNYDEARQLDILMC